MSVVYTALLGLPDGRMIAVGRWPVATEAHQWGLSIQHTGWARLDAVVPLLHPDQLTPISEGETA